MGPGSDAAGGQAAPPRVSWGSSPGWLGLLIVIMAALAGAVVSLLSRTDPGVALGAFVLAGTLAGATIVRAVRAYLIIPVPAPAYAAAAAIAGLVHDRAVDTSQTAVTLNGVRWLAAGFVAMAAATLLAAVVAQSAGPCGGQLGLAQLGPGQLRQGQLRQGQLRLGMPRTSLDDPPPGDCQFTQGMPFFAATAEPCGPVVGIAELGAGLCWLATVVAVAVGIRALMLAELVAALAAVPLRWPRAGLG